eukprot:3041423-Prymnesium_polylepis.1
MLYSGICQIVKSVNDSRDQGRSDRTSYTYRRRARTRSPHHVRAPWCVDRTGHVPRQCELPLGLVA